MLQKGEFQTSGIVIDKFRNVANNTHCVRGHLAQVQIRRVFLNDLAFHLQARCDHGVVTYLVHSSSLRYYVWAIVIDQAHQISEPEMVMVLGSFLDRCVSEMVLC